MVDRELVYVGKQFLMYKWDKLKICGRQPLKIWSDKVCLGGPYHFKFFKDCLPEILLGPFLNTLSKIYVSEHFFSP